MISRLLTKFTVLAVLAAPLITPGAAFAQVCNPADSSMNRCPPINDGGGARNDRRPDQIRPNGPAIDGMHPGNGSGNPSAHTAGGGFGGVGGGAHAAGGGMGVGGGGALPSGGAGP